VGDVGDPAKDKVCNGEPGGVTVCSEDPSVDEVEEDDDDEEEEDVEEDVAADVPEEVVKELDEAKEDTDNEPDVDEESALGHTSAEMPGMANRTCRVCGACTSTSDAQNVSDTMQGDLCYLPVSSPAFRLPADGDTGVSKVRVDMATGLSDSEYVCRATTMHM